MTTTGVFLVLRISLTLPIDGVGMLQRGMDALGIGRQTVRAPPRPHESWSE
jgi:hypothetical protein